MRLLTALTAALALSGCLTTQYTPEDAQHAQEVAYAFARGFMDAKEYERPPIELHEDLSWTGTKFQPEEGEWIAAVYSPFQRKIMIRDDWDPRTVWGQSILVHEYIHHLQMVERTGIVSIDGPNLACETLEKPAYAGQMAFLSAYGGIEYDWDWVEEMTVRGCD